MRKEILGVKVDFGLSMDEVVKKADDLIKRGKPGSMISTTNPYFIMEAQEDSEFKKIINGADLSVPDGVGVLYADYYLAKISKIKKGPLFALKAFLAGLQSGGEGFTHKKEFGVPITGVELTERLFKLADDKKYSVFLLGGKKRDNKGQGINDDYDMAQHVSRIVMSKYPNIHIIGATSSFSREKSDDKDTLKYIHTCMNRHNISSIDIMLVAYNPIMQEKWISRNAKEIPATLSVGIGRTFDYITNVMQPPKPIYNKMHLAWLYTFIKQPWRLGRIVKTFPIFPLKVYLKSIK
jgi:N-acetylglucosaminyldiphosphoundecaprenol N-acetyl-beta-D-mannosaminyltransferase